MLKLKRIHGKPESTRGDATPLKTSLKLFVILVRDNYKESVFSCPIGKASIIGFSFSFLFLSFFIFPDDISDFFLSFLPIT